MRQATDGHSDGQSSQTPHRCLRGVYLFWTTETIMAGGIRRESTAIDHARNAYRVTHYKCACACLRVLIGFRQCSFRSEDAFARTYTVWHQMKYASAPA